MRAQPAHRAASRSEHDMDRRSFVTAASSAASCLLLPRQPALVPAARHTAPKPVRVRGRVTAGGRGLGRVAVSDGLSVVDTAGDGSYELISTTDRPFVSVSLPAGYAIPRNETGTARCYAAIAPSAGDDLFVPFELTRLPESDERHAFLVLADVQTRDMDEIGWFHEQTVPDVRETISQLGVETFGLACGDIMFNDLALFPEYERGVREMGLPCFQVVGNHDLDHSSSTDYESTRTFSQHFGPTYYSFNRGAAHYVVLDDVFWYGSAYLGYVVHEQLEWLAADLERVEPGSPVVVAVHIPVLGGRHVRLGNEEPEPGISVTNREALYRLLEPFDAHIMAGHTHECEHVFANGAHEQVNGAVCGAWWSGPICGDGTPKGYSVYRLDGEQVSWYYKSVGHPSHHQIRVYPRGADPTAPDEIVANVWNWDPDWAVVWYEGGERRGPMARRTGHDPLSVELHTGPELPPRMPGVEPYPVAHLFYAPVAPDARDVRVEAVDRFQRSYSVAVPTPGQSD